MRHEHPADTAELREQLPVLVPEMTQLGSLRVHGVDDIEHITVAGHRREARITAAAERRVLLLARRRSVFDLHHERCIGVDVACAEIVRRAPWWRASGWRTSYRRLAGRQWRRLSPGRIAGPEAAAIRVGSRDFLVDGVVFGKRITEVNSAEQRGRRARGKLTAPE